MTRLAAVDDGVVDVAGIAVHNILAGNGDQLSFVIDILDIAAVGYQNGVAVNRCIDAGLDIGLVCRDIDDTGK